MSSARKRYEDQAARDASLQIDPQLQALASLLMDKRGEYIQTRSLNASSARGIANAARQAIPQVQQAYGGNLAAVLQGTQGAEQQAFARRMMGEQAQATTRLANDASRASQAQVYGNQQARTQYLTAKDKIVQDAIALKGQKANLTKDTLDKLLEGMRQRQVTIRGQDKTAQTSTDNSLRSSGIDPATGKPIKNGPLDPNSPRYKGKDKTPSASDVFKQKYGVPLNTPEAHGAAKDNVDKRLTDAVALKKSGHDRATAALALVRGVPDQPVLDANGKAVVQQQPDGSFSKQVNKGLKAWGNNLWTSIALDIAYDGHVSRKNAAALHRRGYSVKQIGLLGLAAPNPADVLTAGVKAARGIG